MRDLKISATLVLVFAFVLSSVRMIFPEYGFADDYAFLEQILMENVNWGWNIFSVQGRPLSGLLNIAAFSVVSSIDDFWILRVFGLLINAGFVAYFCVWLIRNKFHPAVSMGGAAILCLNPALYIYSSWVLCFSYGLALLLSFIAGELALKSCCAGLSWFHRCIYWLCSIFVLCCALAVNQPNGMAFLIPILVVYGNSPHCKDTFFRMIAALMVCGSGIVIYFCLYKVSLIYFIDADYWAGYIGRSGLSNDFFGKSNFFITTLLYRGLSSWSILLPSLVNSIWIYVFISLIVLGIGSKMIPFTKNILTYLLPPIFLSVCILSVLPLLVVEPNQAPLRTLPVLYMILASPVLWLLQLWSERRSYFLWCIGLSIIFIFSVLAGYLSYTRLVKARVWEHNTVRAAVDEKFEDAWPRFIAVVPPYNYHTPFPYIVIEEYGCTSTWCSWGVRSIVRLSLLSKFPDELEEYSSKEVFILAESPYVEKVRFPVINLEHILFGENSGHINIHSTDLVMHPFFGELVGTSIPGYYFSPWLGFFYTTELSHEEGDFNIYLAGMSPLLVRKNEDPGIWFMHSEKGWFWTKSEVYPWIYLPFGQKWQLLEYDQYGIVQW